METKYYRVSGNAFKRGFWYKLGPEGEKIEVSSQVVPDDIKRSNAFQVFGAILWMVTIIGVAATASEGIISWWWLIATPFPAAFLTIIAHAVTNTDYHDVEG